MRLIHESKFCKAYRKALEKYVIFRGIEKDDNLISLFKSQEKMFWKLHIKHFMNMLLYLKKSRIAKVKEEKKRLKSQLQAAFFFICRLTVQLSLQHPRFFS